MCVCMTPVDIWQVKMFSTTWDSKVQFLSCHLMNHTHVILIPSDHSLQPQYLIYMYCVYYMLKGMDQQTSLLIPFNFHNTAAFNSFSPNLVLAWWALPQESQTLWNVFSYFYIWSKHAKEIWLTQLPHPLCIYPHWKQYTLAFS